MSQLEVTINTSTGICEAPLQLKSNCGTLVIDDFGRQRMRIDELLNRWIVPLETRYDFLNLPNGKKIKVPFDQLVVFSTNLEPRELVDEAFLRRIPYKIEVVDPTEDEFRRLFDLMGNQLGVAYRREVVDYLIADALQEGRPAAPLLPSPRPAAAGMQLLQVPQPPARNDHRAFRPRRGELLRGDVSPSLTSRGRLAYIEERTEGIISLAASVGLAYRGGGSPGDEIMSIALDAMLAATADVCGGQIRIDGTRITVHRIAVLYKQGQSPEDIVQTYPHLSLGQVYAALAYYHANRAEIESELAAADLLYDELRGQGTGRGNAP